MSGRAGVQPEAAGRPSGRSVAPAFVQGGKVLGAVVGLQRTVALSIKRVGCGGAVCGVRQGAHTGSGLDSEVDSHILRVLCLSKLNLFGMLSNIPCSGCLDPEGSWSKLVLEFVFVL